MNKKNKSQTPFYKKKSFIILCVIVAILLMYLATNNMPFFQRMFGEA